MIHKELCKKEFSGIRTCNQDERSNDKPAGGLQYIPASMFIMELGNDCMFFLLFTVIFITEGKNRQDNSRKGN